MQEKLAEIAAALEGVRTSHEKLNSVLSSGPANYYFEKLNDMIAGLFTFSKFKKGGRVFLARDVDPVPSGWTFCAHFLRRGERATVRDVDYRKDRFVYQVEFDNESWIDQAGERHPTTDRHWFLFAESELNELKE